MFPMWQIYLLISARCFQNSETDKLHISTCNFPNFSTEVSENLVISKVRI